MLVVGLCSLGLNVLLDGINLGFILNQFLLDIVQTVIDFRLEDLILFGVMSHRMIGHLLRQAVFISLEEILDAIEADFLLIELSLKVISLGELVGHIIFH